MAVPLFLVISTIATISITPAARLLPDRGMASNSGSEIGQYFLVFSTVVMFLAAVIAGHFHFYRTIARAGGRRSAHGRVQTCY